MPDPDRELARVRTIARVMDSYLVDPLIGFVLPGIGDVIGSLIGFYTVFVAFKRRVSPVIIARMILNLGLDAVLGIIPLVGDAFDIGFKANLKNVDLLTQRRTGRATARDWLVVAGAAAAYLAVMALVVWGVVALFRAL
ncbi:MAG: DUF4112 domain-containing protein [Deltaproteobacteria bacterium]|nr:DUF4112 domain-containing protein [Deltaproteobacteria bacterium]